MSKRSQHAELELLALVSGAMIAMQSRANGELSHRLGNSTEAALISFSSGLLIVSIAALFYKPIRTGLSQLRGAVKAKQIPRWRLFAGMLGGTFVALQTSVVPIIGVALYSVASIAGQTTMSLVVDRIGLTGGGSKKITPRRIAAAVITVIAVLVSVWDRLDKVNFSILAVALSGAAGAFVGVQRALNGQINEHSQQSFATSFLNFVMGTTFLVVLLALRVAFQHQHVAALPHGPWWIYTGGTIGVIYIAFTSTIVQHLGVLTMTLLSTVGTLVGSLIIDIVSPTNGSNVTAYLVSGIVLTYAGVFIGGNKKLSFKK